MNNTDDHNIREIEIEMHVDEQIINTQGASSYIVLKDKPKINGVTLMGNVGLDELGILQPSVDNETLKFS